MKTHMGQWAWIRQKTTEPDGVRAAEMAAAFGMSRQAASQAIRDFIDYKDNQLFSAGWHNNGAAKVWFASQELADAYMARDPALKVFKNAEGRLRVRFGLKALDMPMATASGLQKLLAEALA